MGLLNANDWNCLKSRKNFQADYASYRSKWLDIAKAVYQVRKGFQPAPVLPSDCERDLRLALLGSVSFATYLGKQRHLPPSAYVYLALAVARYLLDYEFAAISGP